MANEKLIDTTRLKYYHDNIASNTFIDKASAQTINGAKTFTSPIYLTNSNFYIEKNSSSNVIDFTVNGTKVLTLGTSSSAVNSVLRANADNSKDLGSSTVRWKDFYLAGNLSDGTNSITVADIAKTSDIPANPVTYSSSGTYIVAGMSKTTYTYEQTAIYASQGLIMGGTAAAAGLVTRGVCGVTTPTTGGACTKDNLYINYDSDNTYRSSRQLVLQAGSVGVHYGNNLYQYCAARGDAVKGWVEAQGYATTDDVHLTQNNTVIVGDALTNISGKSLSAYTSQETTVGGYPVIKILKNGSILSESDASSYMAAQTGSSYVPKYNYDNPSYSYLIFSNGTIYKPQWDSTNGLLLYKMNQLAFKSDVPTISISAAEPILNVSTAKAITLNGTIWKVGSSSGVAVYPLSTSSVTQVDPLHTYLLVPISSTSGTIGNSSTSLTTFYGTAIIRTPIVSSNGDVSCTLIYRSSATGGITSTTRTGIGYKTAHKVGFYGSCIMLDCGSGFGGLLL